MWIAVAIICAGLVALILKYVFDAFGTSGPNPFDIDTREPLKPLVTDMKEKNKVLKQGKVTVFKPIQTFGSAKMLYLEPYFTCCT